MCLIRSVTPHFFGSKPEEVAEELNGIQELLRQNSVELLLDIRPFPNGLQILERSTIVSSTIQRLRNFIDPRGVEKATGRSDRDVVLEAFWKLSPARGLLCFSSFLSPSGRNEGKKAEGVMFCLRCEEDHATADVYFLDVPKPHDCDFPDAGDVTGGDSFVAAFATEWYRDNGTAIEARDEQTRAGKALAAASAALSQTMGQHLGRDAGETWTDTLEYERRIYLPVVMRDWVRWVQAV